MVYLGNYAIVDVREGSASEGKVLVLLDDEPTALEIAIELRRRGCEVVIQGGSPGRAVVHPAMPSPGLAGLAMVATAS
jgi:hypothetical protein